MPHDPPLPHHSIEDVHAEAAQNRPLDASPTTLEALELKAIMQRLDMFCNAE
jgi:hypothetical protein